MSANRNAKKARLAKQAKHAARIRNAHRRHAARGAFLRNKLALSATVVQVINESDVVIVDEVVA